MVYFLWSRPELPMPNVLFFLIRVYPHFTHETLIPMHVSDLVLALKGLFLGGVPTLTGEHCEVQRSSSEQHTTQHACCCLCTFFVHSLHQLEVVTVCSLCIAFMCHFLGVILKQRMAMVLTRSENYSGGGK
jgi:hypothetical protein